MKKKSTKGGKSNTTTWLIYTGIQLGLLAVGLYLAGAHEKGVLNLHPAATFALNPASDARTPASGATAVKNAVYSAADRAARNPLRPHNKFAD